MRSAILITSVLLVIGCSSERTLEPEKPADKMAPESGEILSVNVEPLFWDEQLLDNVAFQATLNWMIPHWISEPQRCAEVVLKEGELFATSVRMQASRSACVFRQGVKIHAAVRHLSLELSSQVLAAEPESVFLVGEFMVDNEPLRIWTSNSGSEAWEELRITTAIPENSDLNDVQFSLVTLPGRSARGLLGSRRLAIVLIPLYTRVISPASFALWDLC